MIQELDVPWSLFVAAHKLLVAGRSLVLVVARQHALYAHAHTLGALHGAPPLVSQQIEAYDSVRVDVRVHGNWAAGPLHEGDFGRFLTCLLDQPFPRRGEWAGHEIY